jgi:excisionase family DNA binding protein
MEVLLGQGEHRLALQRGLAPLVLAEHRGLDGGVLLRFLTLGQVAEELASSRSQAYALVRSGDLPAIKIGGRGQWRVERSALEDYIARFYTETERLIRAGLSEDEP